MSIQVQGVSVHAPGHIYMYASCWGQELSREQIIIRISEMGRGRRTGVGMGGGVGRMNCRITPQCWGGGYAGSEGVN